jgi:hypothetical protein
MTVRVVARILAYLVFPAIVASTFRDSGYIAMLGAFLVTLAIDALLLLLPRAVRKKADGRGPTGTSGD